MNMNTAYLNNKRVSDDDISLCTPPGNNSLVTLDDSKQEQESQHTQAAAPTICPHAFAITHVSRNNLSTTQLSYRSLHHGPDVQPLTDMEKQGVDFTKMPKDKLDRFGPGNFDQFAEGHSY
eukprot:scaffold15490_cov177-Skeletonema_dohrnii-CCMP3373.AAC.1